MTLRSTVRIPTPALALAALVPAGAMATALIAQVGFGLAPCEMCWWQRYAHIAALVLAILALVLRGAGAGRALFWLAVLAIAVSGVIGGYHAGVEYHWWEGVTTCSTARLTGDPLEAIMNAPIVRCDVAAWSLFGISMAGFNCIGSLAAAAVIAVLARKGR